MPTENKGKLLYTQRLGGTTVAQAIDNLVSAGFATIDSEVEPCSILRLQSGEVFMLGSVPDLALRSYLKKAPG